MKRLGVVIGLAVLAACGGGGGGSPTAPPTAPPPPVSGWPAGTVVELVNGETGAAVAGQVVIGGVAVSAGAPLATAAVNGTTVDVVVSGFLSRQTTVKTGAPRLTLWPDNEHVPADYTQTLVYTSGAEGAPPRNLLRLAPRIRSIAVTGDFQGIPEAVSIMNEGLSRYGLTYLVGGAADLTVPVKVEPTAETCQLRSTIRAFARTWSTDGEVTQAEVILCRPDAGAPETIAHELGHVFGLQHSPVQGDLMYAFFGDKRRAFRDREATVAGLMMQRRGGNAWPDNDRGVTARGTRVETTVD